MSLIAVPLIGVGKMVNYTKNELGAIMLTVEGRVFTPTEISKRLSGIFPRNCEQTQNLITQMREASSGDADDKQVRAVEICIEIAAIYPGPYKAMDSTRLLQTLSVFCEARCGENTGVQAADSV